MGRRILKIDGKVVGLTDGEKVYPEREWSPEMQAKIDAALGRKREAKRSRSRDGDSVADAQGDG